MSALSFWTLSLHEKVGSVPMYRHFVVSVSPGLVAFVGFLGRALCFVADALFQFDIGRHIAHTLIFQLFEQTLDSKLAFPRYTVHRATVCIVESAANLRIQNRTGFPLFILHAHCSVDCGL